MKNNKNGASIIEALISMVIIVMWILWIYQIYFNTLFLSDSVNNRIIAIEIAREWIEAVINIRDTNWIKFGADYENCWNTNNYNNNCINNLNLTNTDILSWSYIIQRDAENKWFLSWWVSGDYSNQAYRDFYWVKLDNKWFYTQSWWITMTWALFTREIKIDYIDTNSDWNIDSNDEKMLVNSLVIWRDRVSTKPHKIELSTILTNWKNNK